MCYLEILLLGTEVPVTLSTVLTAVGKAFTRKIGQVYETTYNLNIHRDSLDTKNNENMSICMFW